jgi:hypothetical protein
LKKTLTTSKIHGKIVKKAKNPVFRPENRGIKTPKQRIRADKMAATTAKRPTDTVCLNASPGMSRAAQVIVEKNRRFSFYI